MTNSLLNTRTSARTGYLRPALFIDGLITGVNGLAYAVAAPVFVGWFGGDELMVRSIGGFLIAYGIVILIISRRRAIPRAGATAAVVINLAWLIVSLAAAVSGGLGLSTVGRIWACLQGVLVGAFGVVQWAGLRQDEKARQASTE